MPGEGGSVCFPIFFLVSVIGDSGLRRRPLFVDHGEGCVGLGMKRRKMDKKERYEIVRGMEEGDYKRKRRADGLVRK